LNINFGAVPLRQILSYWSKIKQTCEEICTE